MEAAKTLWTSPDGLAEAGVWECTAGRFTANRETNSEICHIISGRVTLHDQDGRARDVGPGEMLGRPIEMIDMDATGTVLVDARGELFPQALEADQQVSDHFRFAVAAHPHARHPWQELAVTYDIGHHVEHLFG